MKKSILFLTILSLLACNKPSDKEIAKVENPKTEKEIQDSIRKKQEEEVINIDTDLKESQKSLNNDLKKIK